MIGGGRRLDPERLGAHLDRLYRAALGMCGSREEAEDLVQETCVKVLRKPRFVRSGDDLAYLIGVLRNVYYTGERQRARRPLLGVEEDLAASDQAGSDSIDASLEAHEALAAVAGLSDEYRDAVVAVDLAGLSYREAAKLLGTREGTIMSRLYRGRARVAEALDHPSE